MSRKSYGSSGSKNTSVPDSNKPKVDATVTEESTVAQNESTDDVTNEAKAKDTEGNQTAKKPSKAVKAFVITGVCLFIASIIVLAVLVVGVYVFDAGNGEDTAKDAALHYVNAVVNVSEKDILSIVPRQIRKQGVGEEIQKDLSVVATYKEKRNAIASDIQVTKETNWNKNIPALEKGLLNAYGVEIDIVEAKYIDLSAVLSYNSKDNATSSDASDDVKVDENVRTSAIRFGVTVIRIGNKWYVCPNDALVATEETSEDETNKDDKATVTDASSTVSYPTEVKVDTLDLEFYDGALDDLQAGKLNVEANDYVMPIVYKDFKSVVKIEEEIIDEESREIGPNKLLVGVPCNYVNEEYARTGLVMSLGNATDEKCDLLDGIITTYYVGYPGRTFEYPMVYLPGNVTINTSYDDVVKMYGELEKYDRNDEEAKSYCKNLYIASDDVYCLKLNNVHNYIYFGFDADKKLTEIQYYYHDLNGFEDLTVKEESEE